jgi:hypothetical protein
MSLFRLAALQIRQHLSRVLRRVNVAVDARDLAFGRDDVADALRVLGVGRLARPVSHPDLALLVAQQREVVAELFGEGPVVLDAVEAATENLRVLSLEFGVQVAEPATLLRSPRRVGLRVEPKHDTLAAQIRKFHLVPEVSLHPEIGRVVADFEQRHKTSSRAPAGRWRLPDLIF